MNSFIRPVKNEKGSALLITLLALITLTVIGIIAINNSSMELKIAGNERLAKLSFFTAESARGYVVGHGELYNDDVITATSVKFPDGTKDFDDMKTANYVQQKTVDGSTDYYFCLDYPDKCTQFFKGTVTYDSSSGTTRQPPDGSGWAYGSYSANVYIANCEGYFDPSGTGDIQARKIVEQGFFRLGLSGGSTGINFGFTF